MKITHVAHDENSQWVSTTELQPYNPLTYEWVYSEITGEQLLKLEAHMKASGDYVTLSNYKIYAIKLDDGRIIDCINGLRPENPVTEIKEKMPEDDVLLLEHGTKNILYLDRELYEFVKDMQKTLDRNRPVKGESWKEKTPHAMFMLLSDEYSELDQEIQLMNSKGIQLEAVDVANFAMFVYALARFSKEN